MVLLSTGHIDFIELMFTRALKIHIELIAILAIHLHPIFLKDKNCTATAYYTDA